MAYKIAIAVICIVAVIVIAFVAEYGGLQWTRFFKPRYQNVEREVFENTKSYTHGAIQDLAKYYDEYNKADSLESKTTIAAVVKTRFAEFDAKTINADKLRIWFIEIRGY